MPVRRSFGDCWGTYFRVFRGVSASRAYVVGRVRNVAHSAEPPPTQRPYLGSMTRNVRRSWGKLGARLGPMLCHLDAQNHLLGVQAVGCDWMGVNCLCSEPRSNRGITACGRDDSFDQGGSTVRHPLGATCNQLVAARLTAAWVLGAQNAKKNSIRWS